jgi:hypothetical protein
MDQVHEGSPRTWGPRFVVSRRMRGGYHNILLYNMISDTLAGNAYFMIFIKYMIYSIVYKLYIMTKWKNLGKTKLFLRCQLSRKMGATGLKS